MDLVFTDCKEGMGLGPYVVVRSDAIGKSDQSSISSIDSKLSDTLSSEVVAKIEALKEVGGKVIVIPSTSQATGPIPWSEIFAQLYGENTSNGHPIQSIMVEGGATVINSLLDETAARVETHGPPPLVSSVVVTVGPVFRQPWGICESRDITASSQSCSLVDWIT